MGGVELCTEHFAGLYFYAACAADIGTHTRMKNFHSSARDLMRLTPGSRLMLMAETEPRVVLCMYVHACKPSSNLGQEVMLPCT